MGPRGLESTSVSLLAGGSDNARALESAEKQPSLDSVLDAANISSHQQGQSLLLNLRSFGNGMVRSHGVACFALNAHGQVTSAGMAHMLGVRGLSPEWEACGHLPFMLEVTAHNFHHLSLLIMVQRLPVLERLTFGNLVYTFQVCGACATMPLPLARFIPEEPRSQA